MATIGAIPSPPPNWEEEIFEVTSIVGDSINLLHVPTENSQFVFLNGIYLTKDINCDYTLTGNVITFNAGVLTTDGHVTIKYSYS